MSRSSSGTFAHENRFSSLASDDDEKSLDGCDVAKEVTKITSRTWKIGGEQDGFSCRDERRSSGGERDDGFSCCDERVDECMGPEDQSELSPRFLMHFSQTLTMFRTLRSERWTAREIISWMEKGERDHGTLNLPSVWPRKQLQGTSH